ncbi:hydroxymethylglutaryl-CoA reductase, degradative [Candidatus Micrarchaeota archaeon]|nr:hydroxymethylglutaryl-CoA reductase, degradative [Candidatus Micrarchaeota archaeon]
MKTSAIFGFYRLSMDEKLKLVKEFAGLSEEELKLLKKEGALKLEIADKMIENVIGTSQLPFGIATSFLINGKDYLVPMVIEEPSIVAAASNAAKIAREKYGFKASSDEPIMIGQIQILNVGNAESAIKKIIEKKAEIVSIANEIDPSLKKYGGGAVDVEARSVKTARGIMVIVHLLVNVSNALGANKVNTMCEGLTPYFEELVGGTVRLRILSNLATHRVARSEAIFPKKIIGETAVENILDAYEFAKNDIYRCATHNKGIMNGIIAVATATGNDTRALEAGAHAYASMDGYKPLTRWEKTKDGDLKGSIELPIAVGIVGGSISVNPISKIGLRILGVKTARELSEVMASVGLAQNFAAIYALSTEGIQRGHMELHARNIAVIAGAKGNEVDRIAERLVKEKNITLGRAKELLVKR